MNPIPLPLHSILLFPQLHHYPLLFPDIFILNLHPSTPSFTPCLPFPLSSALSPFTPLHISPFLDLLPHLPLIPLYLPFIFFSHFTLWYYDPFVRWWKDYQFSVRNVRLFLWVYSVPTSTPSILFSSASTPTTPNSFYSPPPSPPSPPPPPSPPSFPV